MVTTSLNSFWRFCILACVIFFLLFVPVVQPEVRTSLKNNSTTRPLGCKVTVSAYLSQPSDRFQSIPSPSGMQVHVKTSFRLFHIPWVSNKKDDMVAKKYYRIQKLLLSRMDGQIFLQYLFYGNWPFLLSSLQCLFDSSISISSGFQRNNYTNSLETYFV